MTRVRNIVEEKKEWQEVIPSMAGNNPVKFIHLSNEIKYNFLSGLNTQY